MGYADRRWAPYVPVAERRRKAGLEMAKLRRQGHPVAPVQIAGRTIAATFWGSAWCDNLEGYSDYENRLPRGRTYVRNGSVVDLQIAPGRITAMVSGSSIYRLTITIAAVPAAQWRSLCHDCAGGIDSMVELLQGRFAKGVMERLCQQGKGLFPKPSEIRFSCTCPDGAWMCKHVAAVLYGVGARLDTQPELLFRLRAVDERDLLAGIDTALALPRPAADAGRLLDAEDVAGMFGIEMAAADSAEPPSPAPAQHRPATPPPQQTKAVPAAAPVRKAGKTPPAAKPREPGAAKPREPRAAAKPREPGAAKPREPQPAAKPRKPQPVKWWLPGYGAKAGKG